VVKICVPVIETTVERALIAAKKAERWADLVEFRTDYLKRVKLDLLLKNRRKPFIVTNRRAEEGGKYKGEERERLGVLQEAIDFGAEFIDVELGTGRSFLQNLLKSRRGTQVILSSHDFQKTPSPKALQRLFNKMARWEADVIKVVPFAKSWEDNLTILSLIPFARVRKKKIVAFCMGEKGKISRILSPLLGAAWTYASFNEHSASAPGQLTAGEMKEIWRMLNIS